MATRTVMLLAEMEIEDEGFLTECAREELAAGNVKDLRLATCRELQRFDWISYLLPRFHTIPSMSERELSFAISK